MSQQQMDRATQIKMATAELEELKCRLGVMQEASKELGLADSYANGAASHLDNDSANYSLAKSLSCLAQSQILLHSINLTDMQNRIAALTIFLTQIQSPILQANLMPPNLGGR